MVLIIALLGLAEQARSRGGADDRQQAKLRACANSFRARHGLRKLQNAKPLDQAASLHAHDMARQRFFGHTDPEGHGPKRRVRAFPGGGRFDAVGENIAAARKGARWACRAWRKSPPHRANLLDPKWSFIGGGYTRGGPYGAYFVEVFAR